MPGSKDSFPPSAWERTIGRSASLAFRKFVHHPLCDELHERFRRHGVRPTYVITWPVARDPRSADVLRALRESHTCEIGAHHHAWETPPSTAADLEQHRYAMDLSPSRFDAQLAALTDAIEAAVGERPVSYRSGRFGFAAAHVSPLERAGYLVDSSVSPLFYEAHKGGPEFVEAPLRPYFLAYDSATRPGSSGVLEIPVSAALNRRLPRRLQHAYARAPRPYTTKRILRALRLVRMRWLRPSYSSLEDMLTRLLPGSNIKTDIAGNAPDKYSRSARLFEGGTRVFEDRKLVIDSRTIVHIPSDSLTGMTDSLKISLHGPVISRWDKVFDCPLTDILDTQMDEIRPTLVDIDNLADSIVDIDDI